MIWYVLKQEYQPSGTRHAYMSPFAPQALHFSAEFVHHMHESVMYLWSSHVINGEGDVVSGFALNLSRRKSN